MPSENLSGPKAALALATRNEAEEAGFQTFLDEVREFLDEAWLHPVGQTKPLRLAAYLDHALAEPGTTGDEEEVVDRLAEAFLKALGYEQADISPKRSLSKEERRSVPDLTVRVHEFLGTTPVFVVENKATSVRDLHGRKRKAGDRDETPREQLRRYVLSGAVHGRTGLLCNGWILEAWTFDANGEVRLLQIDLHRLAREASSEPAFPGTQKRPLRVLWDRFSRSSFEGINVWRRSLADSPPMSAVWTARLEEALKGSGPSVKVEQCLLDYNEEVWKAEALDVAAAPELLVDALRGLIEQCAEDVRQQLDDALSRAEEHRAARRKILARTELSDALKQISAARTNFDLDPPTFREVCLDPLERWRADPKVHEKASFVEDIVRSLGGHLTVNVAQAVEQLQLAGAAAPTKKPGKDVLERRRQAVLGDIRAELNRYCLEALEQHAVTVELDQASATAIRTAAAYEVWARRVSTSVLVGKPEDSLRSEFARQTAYVYLVRLLLVRICEDKGLFKRKLSDGGLVLWQKLADQYLDFASGRSYDYLTQMAYDCAQNVYVHFYGASRPFDWYRMDDKMLQRALIVLNAFNLLNIDTDIIGTVYGRYLTEGKHEQGRYYTPRPLVENMLDRAGWSGAATVKRRLADLACGSGSFLVEACRRLLAQYRDEKGNIAPANLAHALADVQQSFYGIDLNPFACYLAETNLLIQVLDLVRAAKDAGKTLTVDRFHIYCDDSLLVDDSLQQYPEGAALLDREEATAELMKARAGDFVEGFDVLVGNPPYVRADEKADNYVDYRNRIAGQNWFTTAHKKWDLYVPFVEQYWRLLSDSTDARCCLVVSSAIGNAPYAEKLRELLLAKSTVHDVLFTDGLELFKDAAWLDPTSFTFSRKKPTKRSKIHRSIASSCLPSGELKCDALDDLVQLETTEGRFLNPRPEVHLNLDDTIPLETLFYVTVGMVLNSHEDLADGEIVNVPPAYDPQAFSEELVEDLGKKGKRVKHRKFGKDDLVSDRRDKIHTRLTVSSIDVLNAMPVS
jgi:type I restriction enzyme M protein